MKFLLVLMLLSPIAAHAECITAVILNEDSDYEGCRVTLDGKTVDQNIPESTCAAYCQLQKAKNRIDTYNEFKKFKTITPKPGEKPVTSNND
ncbi:MAG: hypothetical protein ACXWQO_11140 [Bdellovibrionota bacterium]